jgi:hypothetical protein
MDKDNAASAERDAGNSGSPGSGSTIPQSKDGISTTSTPGGSNFEPEEDFPQDGGEDLGGSDEES